MFEPMGFVDTEGLPPSCTVRTQSLPVVNYSLHHNTTTQSLEVQILPKASSSSSPASPASQPSPLPSPSLNSYSSTNSRPGVVIESPIPRNYDPTARVPRSCLKPTSSASTNTVGSVVDSSDDDDDEDEVDADYFQAHHPKVMVGIQNHTTDNLVDNLDTKRGVSFAGLRAAPAQGQFILDVTLDQATNLHDLKEKPTPELAMWCSVSVLGAPHQGTPVALPDEHMCWKWRSTFQIVTHTQHTNVSVRIYNTRHRTYHNLTGHFMFSTTSLINLPEGVTKTLPLTNKCSFTLSACLRSASPQTETENEPTWSLTRSPNSIARPFSLANGADKKHGKALHRFNPRRRSQPEVLTTSSAGSSPLSMTLTPQQNRRVKAASVSHSLGLRNSCPAEPNKNNTGVLPNLHLRVSHNHQGNTTIASALKTNSKHAHNHNHDPAHSPQPHNSRFAKIRSLSSLASAKKLIAHLGQFGQKKHSPTQPPQNRKHATICEYSTGEESSSDEEVVVKRRLTPPSLAEADGVFLWCVVPRSPLL